MHINRNTMIAVAIQLVAMTWVVIPSTILSNTGTVAYLETEELDPRALFRGDYVSLGYKQARDIVDRNLAERVQRPRRPVYVTFTTERPGQFVEVGFERPDPQDGRVCLVGRLRIFNRAPFEAEGPPPSAYTVDFPQIAQHFVQEGEAGAVERAGVDGMLARIAVNDSCNAVLLGLEER